MAYSKLDLLLVVFVILQPSMSEDDCTSYFKYDGEMPSSFDWVSQKLVGYAHDQGPCNASGIFAAIGVMQSAVMKSRQTLQFLDFSEQSVLDYLDDRQVCLHDIWPNKVWQHVQEYGIPFEHHYEYKEKVWAFSC